MMEKDHEEALPAADGKVDENIFDISGICAALVRLFQRVTYVSGLLMVKTDTASKKYVEQYSQYGRNCDGGR